MEHRRVTAVIQGGLMRTSRCGTRRHYPVPGVAALLAEKLSYNGNKFRFSPRRLKDISLQIFLIKPSPEAAEERRKGGELNVKKKC